MPDLTPRPALAKMLDVSQRWLSSEEAAAYLTLREGEFLRRVKAGLFAEPSRHLGPRTPRWDRVALDAAMAGAATSRRPLSEAIDAELRKGRDKAARGRLNQNLSLRREAQAAQVRR